MDFLTVAIVKVTAGRPPGQRALIHAGGHVFQADERPPGGELGYGPGPLDLVLAGLGACTFFTLETYAARKRWAIFTMQVVLRMTRGDKGQQIERTISIEGLNPRQKAQLAVVAERTPVTLTLRAGISIKTAFT